MDEIEKKNQLKKTTSELDKWTKLWTDIMQIR